MPEVSKKPVEALTASEAAEELARLVEEIAEQDRRYYQQDEPPISDAEYDELRKRNAAIEARFPKLKRADSPSERVGAAPVARFGKVVHSVPMLSLDNAFAEEDVVEFVARVRRFLRLAADAPLAITAEPKIDGLSCSIRYEDRRLVTAATRGDGYEGENVTANIRQVPDVPDTLPKSAPDVVEVRGEIFMLHADFQALNRRLEQEGAEDHRQPAERRRRLAPPDRPAVTASRPLRFFAYTWGEMSALPAETQSGMVKLFAKWGFPTNPRMRVCRTVAEALEFYREEEAGRATLGYDIDGVVYKVDRLDLQARLGFVSRSPRWAIAHKFAAEQAQTILRGIDIQVGRTGVADPGRATRADHRGRRRRHQRHAPQRGLCQGHRLGRRADPRGQGPPHRRHGDGATRRRRHPADHRRRSGAPSQGCEALCFPDVCPVCRATRSATSTPRPGRPDAVRRCTGGLICPAQVVEKLKHFCSRNAFDIEGLGDKQIDAFHAEGLITSPADIFTLQKRDAAARRARSSPTAKATAKSPCGTCSPPSTPGGRIPLHRFIYALGIRHIGETNARLLARSYGTYEALRDGNGRRGEGRRRRA